MRDIVTRAGPALVASAALLFLAIPTASAHDADKICFDQAEIAAPVHAVDQSAILVASSPVAAIDHTGADKYETPEHMVAGVATRQQQMESAVLACTRPATATLFTRDTYIDGGDEPSTAAHYTEPMTSSEVASSGDGSSIGTTTPSDRDAYVGEYRAGTTDNSPRQILIC